MLVCAHCCPATQHAIRSERSPALQARALMSKYGSMLAKHPHPAICDNFFLLKVGQGHLAAKCMWGSGNLGLPNRHVCNYYAEYYGHEVKHLEVVHTLPAPGLGISRLPASHFYLVTFVAFLVWLRKSINFWPLWVSAVCRMGIFYTSLTT